MKAETRELQHEPIHVVESALSAPVVTYIGPGNVWRLEADYSYQDGNNVITVPEGFKFDLASIPRAFWWLISPFELSIAAPLLHDFLYSHKGDPPSGSIEPSRLYTRKQADQLFRQVTKIEGVAAWRRGLAYAAVRSFGWIGWRKG